MFQSIRTTAMACLMIGLFSSPSEAIPGRIGRGVLPALPEAGRLADGNFTVGPRAFQTFCENYPDQCGASAAMETVKLDTTRWAILEEINTAVNHDIVAQSDPEGSDTWTLSASAGDCDDYAVEKRKRLIDLGWPTTALSLAVARVRSGEAHLLLTVRTDHGDFVLDNLRDRVGPAQQTGYRWIARQSNIHPRLWVRIDGIRRDQSRDLVAQSDESSRRPVRRAPSAALKEPLTPAKSPTAYIARFAPIAEAGSADTSPEPAQVKAGKGEQFEISSLVD